MAQVQAQAAVEGTLVEGTLSADRAASLLSRVVRSFVAEPDAVEVGTEVAGDRTLFRLRVAPGDLESVLGASERTFNSLACIVAAFGRRSGLRFALDYPAAATLAS